MDTIVSRNTIKLATTASAVDDYYNGCDIIFTRFDKRTGKKTLQKMSITDYDGATKIATIDGLWDESVIPGQETAEKKDTYSIVPRYPDSRVSINPAIQSLDYIVSERYGRGLNPIKDLYLPSWLESARTCDKGSDVTVEVQSGTLPAVNAVYKYPATGDLLFQGKVVSVSGQYVRFTDVIGKLSNKWNSWKFYDTNTIVYDEDRVYTVSVAGVKTTQPEHVTGTVNGLLYIDPTTTTIPLTKVSGVGGDTLNLKTDGNPVRAKKNGVTVSGYSLYDSDGIDHWRYVGWDEHSQRYVTQHQTNLIVDTSAPLFDNMNSFLEHFGGMLRYNAGRYYLEIEEAEGGIQPTDDPRRVTEDDIVSKINISDDGIRSTFNSLTVAFADPANKFEARNISFFNSEFLKTDRNVPKKGTLSIPGITSYYNARLLADKFLIKSRYNLKISFNMSPKGALLLAGRVIEVPYYRYGWSDKKFRITDLTHNPDCSVDIVAEEYDDSYYNISPIMKLPGVGVGGSRGNTTLASPTNLIATNNTSGNEGIAGIQLTWDNAPGANPNYVTTEVHMSYSSNYQITVTNISANNLLTTSTAHGLMVDSLITSESSSNGLISEGKYYVIETPSSTTFKISYQKGGPAVSLVNGSGAFVFTTARIIAEVPVPENSYFDANTGGETDRIEKYYWIRHRINA